MLNVYESKQLFDRNNHFQMSYKKGVPKTFAKFIRKIPGSGSLFNRVPGDPCLF